MSHSVLLFKFDDLFNSKFALLLVEEPCNVSGISQGILRPRGNDKRNVNLTQVIQRRCLRSISLNVFGVSIVKPLESEVIDNLPVVD